jgi:hypothetical protein
MTEAFLHYLFDNRKLGNHFTTSDGEEIRVIEFGELNANSGPDFLQSKIKFDGKTWAGNIEFHLNSSDWYKHGHQNDTAYNNVIAHFVLNHDKEVVINKFKLPVIELNQLIDPTEFDKFGKISKSKGWIPCQNSIGMISKSTIDNQLTKTSIERLNRKSIEVLELLETNDGNQEKTFFQLLSKAFGAKVNQEAFLSLTDKLNLELIKSLRSEPEKIQSLLHGNSGLLLSSDISSPYILKLMENYSNLQLTQNLKQMANCEWKFSAMRPSNSPSIRIAQLAAVLSKEVDFSKLNEMNLSNWLDYLTIDLDSFWNTHYNFKNECKPKSTGISLPFKQLIITNAVIPYYYAIGRYVGDESLTNKAIGLLHQLPAEKNTIIKNWNNLGVNTSSSYQSQALIELKNEYCNRKKCLFCNIGKKIIE